MALGLFTGADRAAVGRLQRDVERFRLELAKLSAQLSTTAGAALLVRVNEIEAALEALQKSNRREFGKLWKLIGETPEKPAEPESGDDVRARLREQLPIPKIGKGT